MLPPWAQRIADILESRPDKSPAGLARACGIKQGSVSGWLGKGKPTKMISGDNLVAAAAYLETSPEFIMTGRKSTIPNQSQDLAIDLDILKSAIVSVKEALREIGLELEAFIAAPMIAYAYSERLKLPRTMTKDEYRSFDRMVTDRLKGELGHVTKGRRPLEGSTRGAEKASTGNKAAGPSRA